MFWGERKEMDHSRGGTETEAERKREMEDGIPLNDVPQKW